MPGDIEHRELLAQAGESEDSVDPSRSAKQQQAPVLFISAFGCIADDVKTGSVDETQVTQIQDDQNGVIQDLMQMLLQYRCRREIQLAG